MTGNPKGNILIVEDQPELLEAYSFALSKAGYNIFEAGYGAQAMDILQNESISLILLDVVLPDTNGFDLLQLIKSDAKTESVFVILISSKVKSSERQSEGLESGADGYLIKPIQSRELVARIQSFMRHKNTIDELRKSEERFRKVSEKNVDGIIIVDNEGVIHFSNPAAERIFYRNKQFLQGSPFGISIISGENAEINVINKRDGNRVAEIRSVDITWENKDMQLISVRDITERKQMEESLEQKNKQYKSINNQLRKSIEDIKKMNIELEKAKQKSEESDHLKSAFLSNMSHEIRTPLNAIIGFSNIIAEKDSLDEKTKKFTGIIQNSGNQLLHIINDVLDISKIESGQLSMDLEWIDVNAILKSIVAKHRESEKCKKNENTIELITPKLKKDCIINSDKYRFIQIFDNLLTNAIKFTKNGVITVGYNCYFKEKEGKIQFYVKDTGIGISQDQLTSVFERFTQVKKLGLPEGTGLGLSIVQGIIKLLNGKIWVQSEEDKGTTFHFTLPYEERDYSTIFLNQQGEINEIPDFSNFKVFIAEDDFASIVYLKEILEETRAQIKTATNGKELLALVDRDKPDIILLDINMPLMNGKEALKIIRQQYHDLPVVAQTAYALHHEKEEIMGLGCNGYLSKPIDQTKLLLTMNDLLKKNK